MQVRKTKKSHQMLVRKRNFFCEKGLVEMKSSFQTTVRLQEAKIQQLKGERDTFRDQAVVAAFTQIKLISSIKLQQ